jgi:hypothetical protein
LVGPPTYPFLWPFSKFTFDYGFLSQDWNFYGIANLECLLNGILFLLVSIIIRSTIEGKHWWKHFLRI